MKCNSCPEEKWCLSSLLPYKQNTQNLVTTIQRFASTTNNRHSYSNPDSLRTFLNSVASMTDTCQSELWNLHWNYNHFRFLNRNCTFLKNLSLMWDPELFENLSYTIYSVPHFVLSSCVYPNTASFPLETSEDKICALFVQVQTSNICPQTSLKTWSTVSVLLLIGMLGIKHCWVTG